MGREGLAWGGWATLVSGGAGFGAFDNPTGRGWARRVRAGRVYRVGVARVGVSHGGRPGGRADGPGCGVLANHQSACGRNTDGECRRGVASLLPLFLFGPASFLLFPSLSLFFPSFSVALPLPVPSPLSAPPPLFSPSLSLRALSLSTLSLSLIAPMRPFSFDLFLFRAPPLSISPPYDPFLF